MPRPDRTALMKQRAAGAKRRMMKQEGAFNVEVQGRRCSKIPFFRHLITRYPKLLPPGFLSRTSELEEFRVQTWSNPDSILDPSKP